MNHLQRAQDLNLGLGWVYYALGRLVRPRTAVVIGSWRGFVPLILAKALADNVEDGQVIFVDPSFSDDFWKDAIRTRQYFAGFGVTNIRHFLMTTQEFVRTDQYRALDQVGIVHIDGYHSQEQARFDYEAFGDLISADGFALFHDSLNTDLSYVYGPEKAYQRRVKFFIDELKSRADLQVLDLPFDYGLTLVRRSAPRTRLTAEA